MATGRTSSGSLISAAFVLFVFSCLKVASANRTTLYVDEVRGLSELPMSELIHIRSSLVDEDDKNFRTLEEVQKSIDEFITLKSPSFSVKEFDSCLKDGPKSLEIIETISKNNRYIFEGGDDSEASSRMLSVSLPMALPLKRYAKKNNERPLRRYGEHYEEKGKGDTKISKIFQLAVTALSFLAFGGYLLTLIIMAIRRNSGGGNNGNVIVLSNLQGLQSYMRPKRSIFDPAENNFEIEKLYQGMIMLSRTYAIYESKK